MPVGVHVQLSPLARLGGSNRVVTVSLTKLKEDLKAEPKAAFRAQPRAKLEPEAELKAGELVESAIDRQISLTLDALQEGSLWGDLHEPSSQHSSRSSPLPTSPRNISPEGLIGCWLDSLGNTVVVQPIGGSLTELTAVLSRPPRQDIYLSLWQTPDGADWFCGKGKLDIGASSTDCITWQFPDGRTSVWTWCAYTMEAYAMRGPAMPHQSVMPGECPLTSMAAGECTVAWLVPC